MSFRFPLEAVLHLRQSVEHQQELRLRTANQQVARVRHLIEQLDARIRQTHGLLLRDIAAGTTAAEMRFILASKASLQEYWQTIERELFRLEHLRDQQQRVFQQARRDRETLQSLHDHQLRDYERQAARSDQRRLDELFLLRRAYLLRS